MKESEINISIDEIKNLKNELLKNDNNRHIIRALDNAIKALDIVHYYIKTDDDYDNDGEWWE